MGYAGYAGWAFYLSHLLERQERYNFLVFVSFVFAMNEKILLWLLGFVSASFSVWGRTEGKGGSGVTN